MSIENEPIAAEKIRKRKFVAILGTCLGDVDKIIDA
jgi:hypothetical protein